ncbi:MAG: CapA family protein [Bacteroidales bacterium]|nr:CapA family protein [Bacteroidales bacterium]
MLAVAGCAGRGGAFRSPVNLPSLPELLPAPKPDTVMIRIIGDVMLHRGQIEAARFRAQTVDRATAGEFDFTPFLDSIAPDLSAADLAIAGMEFTMAGEPYTGYPTFSAPDSYADYMADCGIDVFLCANNHILDKGVRGLKRTINTLDTLESRGRIRYAGIASPKDTLRNPLIVNVKDQVIAIINFTYGTNVYPELDHYIVLQQRRDEIHPLFARAREQGADFILVCPHWGDEYILTHNSRQEEWAQLLADAGADAIVGAHPHVVQDTTNLTTADGRLVPIYYSIGNAVSNMSAPNTQDELMVTLTISEGKLISITHDWLHCYLPGQLTDSYTTVKIPSLRSE